MKNTEKSLAMFFQKVHSNQKTNQSNQVEWFGLIETIDGCFVRAGENLRNPVSEVGALLFLRCQYAFKTAAGLALAGQVTEAFVMLRSVLEYAGYALLIHENLDLQNVWLGRHVSPTSKKPQQDAFQISKVKLVVKAHDTKLGEIFNEHYERTIDFGGHPNPHAVFGAMRMDENGSQKSLMALALSSDPKMLQHALKSVAEMGLTSLYIFQHIYTAKFELLGIRKIMQDLRATGRL